jgi:hypothetical protein
MTHYEIGCPSECCDPVNKRTALVHRDMYDSMEKRALAAEAELKRVQERLTATEEALLRFRQMPNYQRGSEGGCYS